MNEIEAVQCGKHQQQQSWQVVEHPEIRSRGCISFQGFWRWFIYLMWKIFTGQVNQKYAPHSPDIKKTKKQTTERIVLTGGLSTLWPSLPNAGLLFGGKLTTKKKTHKFQFQLYYTVPNYRYHWRTSGPPIIIPFGGGLLTQSMM